MNGDEKSDPAIVAVKPANKSGQLDAEWVEPRACPCEGAGRGPRETWEVRTGSGHRTGPPRHRGSTAGACPRALVPGAKPHKRGKRKSSLPLLHHIDVALLHRAYHWLKRDVAPGVDGMTWDAYGADLDARLR